MNYKNIIIMIIGCGTCHIMPQELEPAPIGIRQRIEAYKKSCRTSKEYRTIDALQQINQEYSNDNGDSSIVIEKDYQEPNYNKNPYKRPSYFHPTVKNNYDPGKHSASPSCPNWCKTFRNNQILPNKSLHATNSDSEFKGFPFGEPAPYIWSSPDGKVLDQAINTNKKNSFVRSEEHNKPYEDNRNKNSYAWSSYFQRNVTYICDPGMFERSPGCPGGRNKRSCDCYDRYCRCHCSCRVKNYDTVECSEFKRRPYLKLESINTPFYKIERYLVSVDLSHEFPPAQIQPVYTQHEASNLPEYKRMNPTADSASLTRITGALTTFVPGKFTDQALNDTQAHDYSGNNVSDIDRFHYYPYLNNRDDHILPLLLLLKKSNNDPLLKELYHEFINSRPAVSFNELTGELITQGTQAQQEIVTKITQYLNKTDVR